MTGRLWAESRAENGLLRGKHRQLVGMQRIRDLCSEVAVSFRCAGTGIYDKNKGLLKDSMFMVKAEEY